MSQNKYYENNQAYSRILESIPLDSYSKYVEAITRTISPAQKFLEIGSGTGRVLDILKCRGYINGEGVEVSRTSIKESLLRGIKCTLYDGFRLPFKDSCFDLVCSINVIEHVNDPVMLMEEQYRVLNKNGFLLIVCPNFLSITNNYHRHTRGILRKIFNIFDMAHLAFGGDISIKTMEPLVRNDFQADDDAINITNPIQIINWSRARRMVASYASAFQIKKPWFLELIDRSPLRIFFGACFYVLQKK